MSRNTPYLVEFEMNAGKSHTKEGNWPKIFTLEMRQDDPAKCTSAKMRKFGFARSVGRRFIPRKALVLNPIATSYLQRNDRPIAERFGIAVLDCSWNRSEGIFESHYSKEERRLPALLAGNPTNYAKMGRLSSIEAVAAALFIMDFKDLAYNLVSIYKWGDTFLTLNGDILEEYSKATSPQEVSNIESSYFPGIRTTPESSLPS